MKKGTVDSETKLLRLGWSTAHADGKFGVSYFGMKGRRQTPHCESFSKVLDFVVSHARGCWPKRKNMVDTWWGFKRGNGKISYLFLTRIRNGIVLEQKKVRGVRCGF